MAASLYNETIEKVILECAEVGMSQKNTAKKAGIADNTLRKWVSNPDHPLYAKYWPIKLEPEMELRRQTLELAKDYNETNVQLKAIELYMRHFNKEDDGDTSPTDEFTKVADAQLNGDSNGSTSNGN